MIVITSYQRRAMPHEPHPSSQRKLRSIIMHSKIIRIPTLIVGGLLSFGSAENGPAMSLSEFQSLLRTGLDNELVKIIADKTPSANTVNPSGLERKPDTRYHVRRRRTIIQDSLHEHDLETYNNPSSSDFVWNELVHHAQNMARTISRGRHGGLAITDNPNEAHPFPYVVCAHGRKDNSSDSSSIDDMLAIFDKQYGEASLISSSHTETCLILTTTALNVQKVLGGYERRYSFVALPLLDIAKVHYGTIDEVSSQGWSVPFWAPDDQLNDESYSKNATEALDNWERVIEVNFGPGLGGMKEESQLLSLVNEMMGDIQDMGEVGWLRSLDKDAAEKYLIHESLTCVPAISDAFSLTSSLHAINENNSNARITFWQDSFRNGIEAEHACSEMFSTLFVKPKAGYYGYDVVLNPNDGPPPQEYQSSASNPACVMSLIAGLSVHPYVLSVKANFPIYHGCHVAQKLDSARQ